MQHCLIAHPQPWLSRALAVALGVGAIASPTASTAQPTVVFDGSLGTAGPAPTVPRPGGGVDYRISASQGRQVDAALFHSFTEFGVRTDDAASFTGPAAIDQIFARVTGGNASQIDGLLRSEIGSADLWVLNPAGMMFGKEASLEVDGSFHASTADELRFANGERFEARKGGAVPALAVAPPAAFGFLGDDPEPIRVEGELAVPEGETLSLVGGAIEIAGGMLEAPGGRVNLAGVASAGEVVLRARDAAEPLDVSAHARLAPVTIGTGSRVDVSGDPPGAVFIRGGEVVVERAEVLAVNEGAGPGGRISIASDHSVTVRDEALVEAGTKADGPGGDIDITAPSLLIDDARVASTVYPGAGTPCADPPCERGTIKIDVGTLVVRNWVMPDRINELEPPIGLSAVTLGAGDAGRVDVAADSVHLTERTGIAAWTYGRETTGDGGSVHVLADSLLLSEGGWIAVLSFGGSGGDAGDVSLEVGTLTLDGRVTLDPDLSLEDQDPWGFLPVPVSYISALVVNGSTGSAGTITVVAHDVKLTDGGGIDAGGEGGTPGDSGVVDITAESLVIEGRAPDYQRFQPSGVFVNGLSTDPNSEPGTIRIHAGSVVVRDGGLLYANSFGASPAGTIEVTARESVLLSNVGGERLSVSQILLDAVGAQLPLTGLFAGSLGVRDEPASGAGGGRITVRSPEITVGEGAIVAATSLGPRAAGDVVLRGGRIAVSDGGLVDSSAFFRGDAGRVELEATESITVAGRSALGDAASVESVTGGPAAAGTVSLRAPTVRIDEGGRVSTASIPLDGSGIDLPDLFLDENGGPAGAIDVDAERVVVTGGGQIDSSSLTEGRAGDIRIRADDSVLISGAGSRVATRAGGSGAGGNILLEAREVTISRGGQIAAESAPGLGGVALESLVDEGVIGAPPAQATGVGGSIEVATENLRMDGGSIQALSTGSADAGDVRVRAEHDLALTDSTISTEATAGSGGNIAIEARDRLHLVRSAIRASVTSGSGGNVTIGDPQLILLEEGSRIVAQAIEGSGGKITLGADVLLVSVDSLISASSQLGVQGTVEIRAPDTDLAAELAALPESFLDAVALMKERCAARQGGERAGSFVVTGRHGVPASPDGPLPAYAEPAEPALARARETSSEPVAALLLEHTERKPIGFLLGCG